ncbi:MAG: twin-arginine translocase TatA/TatE family subunit [bacterium]|jgi:sec-independent protein translocase protein TatA|nr:twin-arginine translocase TatA/TatE family subunit [bacterium]
MMGIGWGEGIVIFLAILLLFGAKKIPDVARSLGGAITEFKRGLRGEIDSVKKELDEPGEDKQPKA